MPGISDESVLKKWMAVEMGRINDGVVTDRPRLAELLETQHPVATTRGGGEHRFDPDTLRRFGTSLTPGLRSRLRIPVLFYFDSNVADSCLLTDDAALEAFQTLGELSSLRTMIEGKLWVGRAIVYSLVRKYPSIIQIMMR
jgi:uncharacterized protein (UPF0216 family)